MGAFGGKNTYPGPSALSLLLGGSGGIVSTAAGPHLGLVCLCFLPPKTPGKGLPGGGGWGLARGESRAGAKNKSEAPLQSLTYSSHHPNKDTRLSFFSTRQWVQRGLVTCPRSHRQEMAELGHPRSGQPLAHWLHTTLPLLIGEGMERGARNPDPGIAGRGGLFQGLCICVCGNGFRAPHTRKLKGTHRPSAPVRRETFTGGGVPQLQVFVQELAKAGSAITQFPRHPLSLA